MFMNSKYRIAKIYNEYEFAPRAVVYHLLASDQKVKRKINSASSASIAQRTVKLF